MKLFTAFLDLLPMTPADIVQDRIQEAVYDNPVQTILVIALLVAVIALAGVLIWRILKNRRH